MPRLFIMFSTLLTAASIHAREAPLKTASAAAKIAQAGDTVIVAPGIYRESVTLIFQSPVLSRRS